MREHAIAQLGLKPSAFGRHDPAGIGDRHQIFDTGGEHRKRTGKFPAVHQFLQFPRPSNPGQKPAALALAFALLKNPRSRSASMVPVCNIQEWNLSERASDEINVASLIDVPGGMADTIFGCEVDLRAANGLFANESIQVRLC